MAVDNRYMPPSDHVPDNISWKDVESHWGVVFPDDYKAFLDVYGPGTIANTLSITAPSPDGSREHFGGYVSLNVPMDAEMLAELECPFPAYPVPGGIIDIGATPDGDTLFYRTASTPADWHIVTWNRGGFLADAWTEHAMGLSAFLVALFSGQYDGWGGPDLWEVETVAFEHWELEQRKREQHAYDHIRLDPLR
ncbi:SMI1/KNR4 family protein [Actinospica sp. MGRD01-02]|uniref:SMI1/KNR4 family protein n=1 Tax=Actinospica acidithermotolerans TaxID=2828514 RepID=A0A941ELS9_9ACTN|nr:SMI1/KNR4 family protein [Actinospica acidithermotolerans]MBR7831399.1 SMI1/KNR4 family protein [Actinospica acidithermotolerans]